MDWLSTSAEHMNSHAMHFPCLKANVISNSNGLSNNLNNNNSVNNNNNNEVNSNRVLACKDCISYLTSQWESMDAERVPLERRRFFRTIIIFQFSSLILLAILALQIQHSLTHDDLQFAKWISPWRYEYLYSAFYTIGLLFNACQHLNLLFPLWTALGLNISQNPVWQQRGITVIRNNWIDNLSA